MVRFFYSLVMIFFFDMVLFVGFELYVVEDGYC